MSRRQCLSALSGSAAVSLAGCLTDGIRGGNSETRAALSERTLRYGAVVPLSGGLSTFGDALANGTTLPVAELEDADLDATIEHDVVDSETTPTSAVDAAAGLIDDGYQTIVGAASSGVTLQMTQQATIPAGTVSCSPMSTSPTLSILNDRGYSFRTAPNDSLQGAIAAQLASTEHDAETAATLYMSGDYGRQLSGSFSASFDGTLQRQVPFTPGSDSYADPLERALADDPDILFLVSYVESGVDLLREYYADHENGEDVFVTDGLQGETVPDKVGQPLSNVFGTAPSSSGPGRDGFESLYRSEYGTDPALFTSNCYDAAATVLLANAAAGVNDGTEIRARMNEVTTGDGTEILPGNLAEGIELAAAGEPVHFRGASGEIEFDENGDGGSTTYEYFTYADGDISVLGERTPQGVAE
ncbi:ABC transporter substrate-binding protein [Halopiger djelfimassiliensis]|uniref:ABC transporter substrate-binding protein n=1 Tax=Halopiger djelfimassiliensis TaxID=1293047 RepID=UPI0009DC3A04|nr:ABC transporter substrate-binding protein [Halopiger djelfimassiliensis]